MSLVPQEISWTMISDSWLERQKDLEDHIEKDGFNNFMQWSVIQSTMVRGWTEDEQFEADEARKYFLNEHLIHVDISTGTVAQQAYALMLMDQYCMDLSSVKAVVELGAGLGDLARISEELMPNLEEYRILDLPPMLQLQSRILGNHKYKFYSDTENLFDKLPLTTVFVSICGVSETPLALREAIRKRASRKFVLRVQSFWDGENILGYFQSWSPTLSREAHFKGHWWLIR